MYKIGLSAGECPNFVETYSVLTGYNSVSGFIIEEIPEEDPECQKLISLADTRELPATPIS